MKYFLALLFIAFFSFNHSAAQHSLTKLWETDTVLKVPESVCFDKVNKILYVSNIDGEPWAMDGKGSVGKIGLDGKIITAEWVQGLNAPKGIGINNGKLYVADVTGIAVIDIQKAVIENRISIDDSAWLNDVSVSNDGVIWVSDSKNKRIYKIINDKPVVYLENLKGPNGVLNIGNDLYILDAGKAFKVNADKTLTQLADGMEGGTDGIENVSGSEFIISCWEGAVWYADGKGNKQLLLDTRAQKKNSADIGYDAANKIVYVPTFRKNSVVAYQLK